MILNKTQRFKAMLLVTAIGCTNSFGSPNNPLQTMEANVFGSLSQGRHVPNPTEIWGISIPMPATQVQEFKLQQENLQNLTRAFNQQSSIPIDCDQDKIKKFTQIVKNFGQNLLSPNDVLIQEIKNILTNPNNGSFELYIKNIFNDLFFKDMTETEDYIKNKLNLTLYSLQCNDLAYVNEDSMNASYRSFNADFFKQPTADIFDHFRNRKPDTAIVSLASQLRNAIVRLSPKEKRIEEMAQMLHKRAPGSSLDQIRHDLRTMNASSVVWADSLRDEGSCLGADITDLYFTIVCEGGQQVKTPLMRLKSNFQDMYTEWTVDRNHQGKKDLINLLNESAYKADPSIEPLSNDRTDFPVKIRTIALYTPNRGVDYDPNVYKYGRGVKDSLFVRVAGGGIGFLLQNGGTDKIKLTNSARMPYITSTNFHIEANTKFKNVGTAHGLKQVVDQMDEDISSLLHALDGLVEFVVEFTLKSEAPQQTRQTYGYGGSYGGGLSSGYGGSYVLESCSSSTGSGGYAGKLKSLDCESVYSDDDDGIDLSGYSDGKLESFQEKEGVLEINSSELNKKSFTGNLGKVASATFGNLSNSISNSIVALNLAKEQISKAALNVAKGPISQKESFRVSSSANMPNQTAQNQTATTEQQPIVKDTLLSESEIAGIKFDGTNLRLDSNTTAPVDMKPLEMKAYMDRARKKGGIVNVNLTAVLKTHGNLNNDTANIEKIQGMLSFLQCLLNGPGEPMLFANSVDPKPTIS